MEQRFTYRYNGTAQRIVTDIHIKPTECYHDCRILHYEALWDTGSTNSVISKDLAKRLQLKSIGQVNTYTAAGKYLANLYLIDLYLPNNLKISRCKVNDGMLDVDMLIGMDIISLGDFVLQNKNNVTTFTFIV